jgi:hypothetical protein
MQLFIFFLFFHYMFRLHAAIFRWLFPLYTVLQVVVSPLYSSPLYSSVEKNCIEGKQPSSGGCFPSIQYFSTEAAAFVMPILFSDYCENMWYPCAFVGFLICFLMSCVVLCGLCSCHVFYILKTIFKRG